MRKLALIAAAAVLLAGAGSALALTGSSKAQAPTDYASCLKKAGTTVAMEACINAEIKRLTGLMNTAYRTLSGTAGVNRAALASAQSRWVTYRAADCKFAGTLNAGGSLQPIDVGTCTVDLTSARLAELRVYQKQAKH